MKYDAQRVNVSSKMIKEMGIEILDRVNEMLSDEKMNSLTFSNGWLLNFKEGGDFAAVSRSVRS